ncbi:MAG: Fmu (Sun) domain-containing protein [Chitinophagales bacterium]|nr:Fmu (Sun) domain-containing protein [Chitinophagales bacterium]
MRFQSHFSVAIFLINKYDGTMPLSYFLKKYFSENKKHGSKDRKYISHLCYCYFRLGKCIEQYSTEERLKIALFLCNESVDVWKNLYDEVWINNWQNNLLKRIEFIQQLCTEFNVENIFPFVEELSNEVDANSFIQSHLIQPNLFLRIRPKQKELVINKLTDAHFHFELLNETCVALPNSSKVNEVLNINKEAVIQDYSSQQIAHFFSLVNPTKNNISIWDCCAASGGKSILAKDIFENIQLTVSDIRKSIIQNLQNRFAQAGIYHFQFFVADIALSNFTLPKNVQQKFQLIICDVPCSGSGTWSRTPEQIYFFTEEKINEYAALQKRIVSNALKHLAENSFFLYITCSVFKKENEEVVAYILKNSSLQLIEMKILKGYDKKADTMFAALFTTKSK